MPDSSDDAADGLLQNMMEKISDGDAWRLYIEACPNSSIMTLLQLVPSQASSVTAAMDGARAAFKDSMHAS